MTIVSQAPDILARERRGELHGSIITAVDNGFIGLVADRLNQLSAVPELHGVVAGLSAVALKQLEEREEGLSTSDPSAEMIADVLQGIGAEADTEKSHLTDRQFERFVLDVTFVSMVRDIFRDPYEFFSEARSLRELREKYAYRPDKDTEYTINAFNAVAAERIVDTSVSFVESDNYYDSLKSVSAEVDEAEESAAMEHLHLALDRKFLALATNLRMENHTVRLAQMFERYSLKTAQDHDNYESMKRQFDLLRAPSFFDNITPEFFTGEEKIAEYSRADGQQKGNEHQSRDYSEVELDVDRLVSAETPELLKSLYAEVLSKTNDSKQTKQVFIATAIDRLTSEGLKAGYGVVYSYSRLYDLVDSPDVKQQIARGHDSLLLAYANKLYEKGDYQTIYRLLSTVEFLSGDSHPSAQEGNLLLEKARQNLQTET